MLAISVYLRRSRFFVKLFEAPLDTPQKLVFCARIRQLVSQIGNLRLHLLLHLGADSVLAIIRKTLGANTVAVFRLNSVKSVLLVVIPLRMMPISASLDGDRFGRWHFPNLRSVHLLQGGVASQLHFLEDSM